MFGRRKSSRIRHAEQALKHGRLDQAFVQLTGTDLSRDETAARMLGELCEPLLRRAREHLIGERFAEALADIERASRCGVMREKVEEWRQRTLSAMEARQRQKRHQQAVYEAAERGLADGHLTRAREHLAQINDEERAISMTEEAERRAHRARQHLSDARAALAQGEIEEAVHAWLAAKREHASAAGVLEIEAEICQCAAAVARVQLAAGRLDHVRMILTSLKDVGRGRAERADLEQMLALSSQAAIAFEAGQFGEASVALGRLSRLAPDLEWVEQARDDLNEISKRRSALIEGPLGFLLDSAKSKAAAAREAPFTETVAAGPRRPGSPPHDRAPGPRVGDLGRKLILRIDGVGSFLLLRGDFVTVGRAGTGATADLPLFSDLPESSARIIRSGDEYFLVASAEAGARVGGQSVRQALLNDGDRIQLGRRARLTFYRPSRKSNTAVLELAAGLRTVSDVRRVVLLGGPLLLGAAGEAHIRFSGADLVLYERGGEMFVRAMSPVLNDACGGTYPLPPGEQVTVGQVRMSLQACNGSG
jgi:tetratricopeptide (TPR) repeat protein